MARVNEKEDEENKEEEGGRLKGDKQLFKRINIVFSEKHHSEFLCLKQPIILSIILPKDMKGISYKLNSFSRVKMLYKIQHFCETRIILGKIILPLGEDVNSFPKVC